MQTTTQQQILYYQRTEWANMAKYELYITPQRLIIINLYEQVNDQYGIIGPIHYQKYWNKKEEKYKNMTIDEILAIDKESKAIPNEKILSIIMENNRFALRLKINIQTSHKGFLAKVEPTRTIGLPLTLNQYIQLARALKSVYGDRFKYIEKGKYAPIPN